MIPSRAVLALVLAAAASAFISAPVVVDNPAGTTYSALFVPNDNSTINGDVVISTFADGTGVEVQMTMSGFPGENTVADYRMSYSSPSLPR